MAPERTEMSVLRVAPHYHLAIEADKHIVRCFELLAAFDTTGCRHMALKAIPYLEKLHDVLGDSVVESLIEILILSGRPNRCWDFLPDGMIFEEIRNRIARARNLVDTINSYGTSKLELDLESTLDIMNSLPGTNQMLMKALGDPKLIESTKGV